jgi:hypothetical protein
LGVTKPSTSGGKMPIDSWGKGSAPKRLSRSDFRGARPAAGPRPFHRSAIASGRPPLPTLTSAHSLTTQESARSYPVHLYSVVTYYDPHLDTRRVTLFVNDSSGGIYVAMSSPPAIPFKAGDLVEVIGVSAAGDFAPIVSAGEVRRVGISHPAAVACRPNGHQESFLVEPGSRHCHGRLGSRIHCGGVAQASPRADLYHPAAT